jgi:hypothetical protein
MNSVELNKTYNIAKNFERKFSKRRIVKKIRVSTSTSKYYGNNDLNFNLTNAMLVLSPTVMKKPSSTSSLSSLSSNETLVENIRCCNVVSTVNKNKTSAVEIAQQTIQVPFTSDDDGFYSDSQPKSNIDIGKSIFFFIFNYYN